MPPYAGPSPHELAVLIEPLRAKYTFTHPVEVADTEHVLGELRALMPPAPAGNAWLLEVYFVGREVILRVCVSGVPGGLACLYTGRSPIVGAP